MVDICPQPEPEMPGLVNQDECSVSSDGGDSVNRSVGSDAHMMMMFLVQAVILRPHLVIVTMSLMTLSWNQRSAPKSPSLMITIMSLLWEMRSVNITRRLWQQMPYLT